MNKLNTSKIILILLALSTSVISGCSSIRSRYDAPESHWSVYPGVQRDGSDLIDTFEGKTKPEWTSVVVVPVLLLDVPFSLILDTILFPYDAYIMAQPAPKASTGPSDQATP